MMIVNCRNYEKYELCIRSADCCTAPDLELLRESVQTEAYTAADEGVAGARSPGPGPLALIQAS